MKTFPMEVEWDEGPTDAPNKRKYRGGGTPVRIKQNWPDPEIKGVGVVKTKDGKVKTDGSNFKQRSG